MVVLLRMATAFAENDQGFVEVSGFDAAQGNQERFDQDNFIIG